MKARGGASDEMKRVASEASTRGVVKPEFVLLTVLPIVQVFARQAFGALLDDVGMRRRDLQVAKARNEDFNVLSANTTIFGITHGFL